MYNSSGVAVLRCPQFLKDLPKFFQVFADTVQCKDLSQCQRAGKSGGLSTQSILFAHDKAQEGWC